MILVSFYQIHPHVDCYIAMCVNFYPCGKNIYNRQWFCSHLGLIGVVSIHFSKLKPIPHHVQPKYTSLRLIDIKNLKTWTCNIPQKYF
jgi:hypothetical protein